MTRRIDSANAEYQVLRALVSNRQTRNRENAFIVEGVRNVNAAIERGWTVRTVLTRDAGAPSAWAVDTVRRIGSDTVVRVEPSLFDALTVRAEPPELLLVVEKQHPSVDRLAVDEGFIATVFDRPSNPGNIGTMVRTCDALGSAALLVLGHGADPYDPQSIRASTGSFFAVPTIDVASADALIAWARANDVALIATDEAGDDIGAQRFAGPVAVLMGNETKGLSRALLDGADRVVAIPMIGTATSLNVAAAHAIVLHEIARSRRNPASPA